MPLYRNNVAKTKKCNETTCDKNDFGKCLIIPHILKSDKNYRPEPFCLSYTATGISGELTKLDIELEEFKKLMWDYGTSKNNKKR